VITIEGKTFRRDLAHTGAGAPPGVVDVKELREVTQA
jgi:hypothetical protein